MLTGGLLAAGFLVACGGSISWVGPDGAPIEAIGDGGGGGGVCGACTTNQECQANCVSSSAVYCCDLNASVGGQGLCYALMPPATTCPASGTGAGASDAGARGADAGRTTTPTDAGARRNFGGRG
ncbi:MAG TPA: hypothetical protein VE987_06555 [Polyangiaceae bacterium]|nr:hypothetical protein [Polyangiaceae bacterium]